MIFFLVVGCAASSTPEVLILGGSVSGGGGVGNRPDRAWHAALADVRVTVQYKNAVSPSYFLHCTERFVQRRYDVVLIDLGANMFGSRADQELAELIRRAWCLSNATSVGVISWPGPIRTNASRAAAALGHAALIDVPHERDLYADGVHPNARGHALIAQRVQEHLASRSRAWRARPSGCAPATTTADTCFPSAASLPVERDRPGAPLGWQLVDDSPTPDRVHKYGWTSARRGASLTLVLPPGDVCGAVITLAYLASKATGPFRLTCAHGCACSPIRTYWQRRLQPFPIVTGQEDCNGETRNCDGLQVTRDTSFDLLREREGECRVTVTVLMNRRVRLDGLYVQTPSEETAAYMRGHASSTTAQRRFGERARSQRCNKTRTVEMTR